MTERGAGRNEGRGCKLPGGNGEGRGGAMAGDRAPPSSATRLVPGDEGGGGNEAYMALSRPCSASHMLPPALPSNSKAERKKFALPTSNLPQSGGGGELIVLEAKYVFSCFKTKQQQHCIGLHA